MPVIPTIVNSAERPSQASPWPLILASGSPRRRELLAGLGYAFRVQPADIDERPLVDEDPQAHVLRLAREKAAVVASANPETVVLAADTIVVHAGQILGKPRDTVHAQAMLAALSGTTHQVLTAVAIHGPQGAEGLINASEVRFRRLSAADIQAYVDSGEPMDKAGAYGIQGGAARFVEYLAGSYTGIMGLPLCQTEALLHQAGCRPRNR